MLDDLDRAEQHGDLVEGTPFAVIADKVRAVVERLGVVPYGEKGEEFDPQRHEAIFQQPTPGVDDEPRSSRSSRRATASATSSCVLRRSSSPFLQSR